MARRMTAEKRRQSIVDAALKQFAAKGFNGTKMRDISKEAGINEALIYRYFPGKEELYSAALDEIIARLKNRPFFEHVASTEMSQEKIPMIAENALTFMADNPPLTRMLLYSGLQRHDLAAPFFDSVSKPVIKKISAYIKECQESGEMRDDIDPFMGAVTFISSIVFINIAKNVFQHELFTDIDIREFTQTISKIHLRGLSAEKGVNGK